MCLDAASLRVRWPEAARAPAGAAVVLDDASIMPSEAELGVCAAPGAHTLRVQGALARTIEILPGAETRVALSAGQAGTLAADVSFGTIDVPAMVASLGTTELPSIAFDARPEERRVFAPVLAAAFDAWRARLTRVTEIAATQTDSTLRTACADHEIRANAIALTLTEERPSADRLAGIRRAMESEVAAAGTMIPIERSCPLYADEASTDTTPLTIEARPYVGPSTSVVRIRIAIDDVEVLDTGAPQPVELFERVVADGIVPRGEHVVAAEVTFADRGGLHARRPVLPTRPLTVLAAPMRIVIRALGDGTVEITVP